MPLDDREQRILEEIERHFRMEDPKLVETVQNTSLVTIAKRHLRWATLGLIAGLALLLVFFTRSQLVALVGFGLMVVSGFFVVTALRRSTAGRATERSGPDMQAWLERLRRRWRPRG